MRYKVKECHVYSMDSDGTIDRVDILCLTVKEKDIEMDTTKWKKVNEFSL